MSLKASSIINSPPVMEVNNMDKRARPHIGNAARLDDPAPRVRIDRNGNPLNAAPPGFVVLRYASSTRTELVPRSSAPGTSSRDSGGRS